HHDVHEESNFMGAIFMDKIDASISQKYKLYSESTILYYDKNKIESQVVHDHPMIVLGKSDIRESPLCIRKLKSNIKAILLPVIGTLDTIKYNEISSIYYSLMKESDLNKKHPVYCLSKVDKDEYYRYDQFYSRAANILVVNTKQKENGSVAIQKEIEFTKTMNGFGKYSCNVTRATPAYKNNLITITNTYFLPADNVVFNLTDIVFNNNHSDNLASCIGKYDDWGKLKFMNIRKQGLNALTISINDFSSSNKNILIKGNKIYLNENSKLTKVEVACTYVTNVNTSFITRQNFNFPRVAIQKEIEFTKTMDGFGKYSCNVTRATPAYKNNLITITNTYFLPADNVVFNLTDIVLNNNHSDNLVSCIGKYDDWGNLKLMSIRKQGTNTKTISINDISTSNKNILIKDNKIYLKESFNLTTVEVACTYVTNVNTSFITKQNFKFPEYSN
uniref:Ig-like domain-containing protein n=1 Tax=Parastrongyloides trichosuri TaxID=131310 RepID=A0A0N4ZE11_PARTI